MLTRAVLKLLRLERSGRSGGATLLAFGKDWRRLPRRRVSLTRFIFEKYEAQHQGYSLMAFTVRLID